MSSADSPLKSTTSNPLLEPLEKFLSVENLAERLQSWPLVGVDVDALDTQGRHDLLDRLEGDMFQPTLSSIDTTTRLYRMVRLGLQKRNPTLATSRARTMQIALMAGKDLLSLPWLPTYSMGMRYSGITGCGKTYEILRALSQLPQVIRHSQSRAADWNHMSQVTWLYVAMSHDGSLGGLLLQILMALDAAIDTAYSSDRRLTRLSNEKLAVHVGIILNNHGVGVLVIDELQGRNFAGGARGGLAATFFLRLLNFGVPLVLMGNPIGMAALDTFSQDLRRVGSNGNIEMHPLEKFDFDFTHGLAPALWRYNVMPEPSPVQDDEGEILFKYCGGIRAYATRMRICSQRIALDQGDRFVTEVHMQQAYCGPDFSSKEREIIAGFRDHDPLKLLDFEDIPWRRYALQWGKLPAAEAAGAPESKSGTSSSDTQASVPDDTSTPQKRRKPVSQQSRENVERQRTRRATKKADEAAILANADPSDMRSKGVQDVIIAALDQLQFNAKNVISTTNQTGV